MDFVLIALVPPHWAHPDPRQADEVKGNASLGAGSDNIALKVLGLPPLKLHLTFIALLCLLFKECGENVNDKNYCDDASHGARDYDCQGILNSYKVLIKLWMKGYWFGYPTCFSCDGTSPSLVVSLPSWSTEDAEVNPTKSTNKITLQRGYILLFLLRVARRNN